MLILHPEIATAESIAPFGALVGARHGATRIMAFDGVQVFGAIPFAIEGTPELLVCELPKRDMRVGLMERHFRHNQAYLPMNGMPFVMVLAPSSQGALPPLDSLRAFLFQDGCGIALGLGVWHEFPFACRDRTQIAVVLTAESHIGGDVAPEVPDDADGPDLQRRSFANRSGMEVRVGDVPDA